MRGLDKDLVINGSLSYDRVIGNNEGMSFTWRYGKINGPTASILWQLIQDSLAPINNSNIQNLGNASGRVLIIDSDLIADNEMFIVNLTVAKSGCFSNVLQVVHIVKDPPRIFTR